MRLTLPTKRAVLPAQGMDQRAGLSMVIGPDEVMLIVRVSCPPLSEEDVWPAGRWSVLHSPRLTSG